MSDSFVTPWTVAGQDPLTMGVPRHNTGVDRHFLLQGIFPAQELNLYLLCLLHLQVDSLLLSYLGSTLMVQFSFNLYFADCY